MEQTYHDFEIIIVDDCSTDDSLQLIEQTYAGQIRSWKLKLVSSNTNRWFAYTNNKWVSFASGEYICLLNNDTIIAKNALQAMVSLLDLQPKLGWVTGMIMDKWHEKEMRDSILHYKYKPVHSAIFSTVYVPQDENDQQIVHVDGISGCCFMYRASLIKEPFKDYYRAYGEDTYLSLVIRSQGYALAMIPQPLIAHLGSASFGQKPSVRKVYHGVKNEIINMYFFSTLLSFYLKLPTLLYYHFIKLFLGGGSLRLKWTLLWYKWFFSHKRFLRQEKKLLKKTQTFHGSLFSARNIFSPTYGPGEHMFALKKVAMQLANFIARIYLTVVIHDKKD